MAESFDRTIARAVVFEIAPWRWDRFTYATLWRLTFSEDAFAMWTARVLLLAIHALFAAAILLGYAMGARFS